MTVISSTALAQSLKDQRNEANRLSSGKRITSASDDAAGLAIATRLNSDLVSNRQASRNVGDSFSMSDTAGSAIQQLTESATRIRELVMQASNGSTGASEKNAIQQEIDQLGQGMDQIAKGTNFNGQKLLDGTLSTTFQAGPDVGDSQTFSLGDMTQVALGFSGINVTTSAGASSALAAVDAAIDTLNTQQGAVGASQASSEVIANSLDSAYVNGAEAKSRIADLDYGSSTSNQATNNVRVAFGMQMQALQNAAQSNSLQLIG